MKYETDSRSERVGCESGKVSDGTHRFDRNCPLFGGTGAGLRFFRAVGPSSFLHARGSPRIREAALQPIRLDCSAENLLEAYQTRHRLVGNVLICRLDGRAPSRPFVPCGHDGAPKRIRGKRGPPYWDAVA
jgi:hypothetical protein